MHVYHAALIFFLLEEEEKLDTWKHSPFRKEIYSTELDANDKTIRANKIPWCGLLSVNKIAWRQLYEGKNDPGLITFTGMNHYKFTKCLQVFALYFDSYTPFSPNGKVSVKSSPKGWKCMICPEDSLGLTLAWTRTRGGQIALNLIFAWHQVILECMSNLDSQLLCSVWIHTRMQGFKFQVIQSSKNLHQVQISVYRSWWCMVHHGWHEESNPVCFTYWNSEDVLQFLAVWPISCSCICICSRWHYSNLLI